MEFKRIEVVCGPGMIAYEQRDGILRIFVHGHAHRASPAARHMTIEPGKIAWGIEEQPDDPVTKFRATHGG